LPIDLGGQPAWFRLTKILAGTKLSNPHAKNAQDAKRQDETGIHQPNHPSLSG